MQSATSPAARCTSENESNMTSCVLCIECAFQSEAAWQSERPKKEQFARNYVDIDHEGSANGCAQSGQQPNKLHQVGVLQELPATSTAPRLAHGRCRKDRAATAPWASRVLWRALGDSWTRPRSSACHARSSKAERGASNACIPTAVRRGADSKS